MPNLLLCADSKHDDHLKHCRGVAPSQAVTDRTDWQEAIKRVSPATDVLNHMISVPPRRQTIATDMASASGLGEDLPALLRAQSLALEIRCSGMPRGLRAGGADLNLSHDA